MFLIRVSYDPLILKLETKLLIYSFDKLYFPFKFEIKSE